MLWGEAQTPPARIGPFYDSKSVSQTDRQEDCQLSHVLRH
jgi:hypothetical protein